ncbi:MAG: hypothetical protein JNL98_32985 [Bryobacterales bacterium]|nr:hypothetical protein [Bryobacterales bacterium]
MAILRALGLALVLASLLFAQETMAPVMWVNVPFSFEVAGQRLPPGDYTVEFNVTIKWVLLKSAGGQSAAVVSFPIPADPPDGVDAKLVFLRYGDRRFLAEARHPRGAHGVVKSKQEKELVTSRLIAGGARDTISIVARLGP